MAAESLRGNSLRGKLLVASPSMHGPIFSRTVIAMLEHNDDGALGVVINRPSDAPLSEVVPSVADLGSDPAVLFRGGPVDQNASIALGIVTNGAAPEGWAPVVTPLVTVDLDHDPALLAISLRSLRVFVGYAGWSGGQLEAEIGAGAWYVIEALPSDPFDRSPALLWSAVLRRQSWPLSAVATAPIDPTQN